MIFYLLVVLFVLLAIHVSIRYSRSGRLLNQIPGPFALPIIGNAISFLNADAEYIFSFVRECMTKYGPIMKIWFSTISAVVTCDPEDFKILLTDRDLPKAKQYKYLEIWAKNGLITSEGELWRHRRKILTPAFGPNILKKYLEIVEEQGKRFITELSAEDGKSIQDLIPLTSKLAICIICKSGAGIDLSTSVNEAKTYKQAVSDFLDVIVYKLRKPYIPEWVLKLTEIGRKQKDCLKTLKSFTKKMIYERQRYHEENKSQFSDNFTNNDNDYANKIGKPHKKLVTLDLLLTAKDQGVRAEIATFIVAGYDTSAMALVYFLMLLAENREVQEKARAEAFEVMDRCNGNITMDDVQNLDYIERCVKESLRLLPSVPMVFRNANKEIQLKNKIIPKGVEIALSIYDMHRDPKHWPEPEKFDPDRFLPENSRNRHSYAYLPFSAGPRVCIGQKFALMELKTLMARILYNFSLEPITQTRDLKFQFSIDLIPTTPVYVKFMKLKRN